MIIAILIQYRLGECYCWIIAILVQYRLGECYSWVCDYWEIGDMRWSSIYMAVPPAVSSLFDFFSLRAITFFIESH